MSYFQKLVVNVLAFISLSVLLPAMFYVSSFKVALVASLVLSVLNLFIKPVLVLLSLPITVITFGLFSFIINAMMLQMTSFIIGQSHFAFLNFGSSILIAMMMTVINSIVSNHFRYKS